MLFSRTTKSLSKYIIASCAIYATSVILDISPFDDPIGSNGESTRRVLGVDEVEYRRRKRKARRDRKKKVNQAASNLALIKDASILYDMMFTSETTPNFAEFQKQVSKLPSLQVQASFMYDLMFPRNPKPEIAEFQKQVRIRHFNCSPDPDADYDLQSHPFPTSVNHPDSRFGIISCIPVHYRIPAQSTQNIHHSIVFGVLTSDKKRRNAIRKTWGQNKAVFFVVAGEWDAIEEEYKDQQDLIWIDQPELYRNYPFDPVVGGALTFKTEVFLLAAQNQIIRENPNIDYFVKTDDDCYVDVNGLSQTLSSESKHGTVDYWGMCMTKSVPYRKDTKNYVSWKDYPFSYFPDYCIGSGYVMSTKLLNCAVGEGHIEKARYLPIEDGAVGLLAERCGASKTGKHIDLPTHLHFNQDRLGQIKAGGTLSVIIQHNIKTEEDMIAVHEGVTRLKTNTATG